MLRKLHFYTLIFLLSIVYHLNLSAQDPLPAKSASEILHAMQKLQVLGSVLYVAAHPDDENQRILAYYTGEKKFRAAYLSLTRGDGGQNLIGDEKGPSLGMLRTQELLGARRIDGAEQIFSRAIDFGYSKHPDETLNVWDRDEVLADVVWAIRKYQPDIIITRFSAESAGRNHGHHTTSAMLANEAFNISADPNVFPEQLKYVEPWQAKRVFWNDWRPMWDPNFNIEEFNGVRLDIGIFNPLLGKSYGEIAMEARSMHKCQAFGAAKLRGSSMEYLTLIKGEAVEDDAFSGINTDWTRVKGGENVAKWLDKAIQDFSPVAIHRSLPALMEAHKALSALEDGYWKQQKMSELESVITYCAGLWFEANSKNYGTAIGDTANIELSMLNRSGIGVELISAQLFAGDEKMGEIVSGSLEPNKIWKSTQKFVLKKQPPTQPYWLANQNDKGMFKVDNQTLIGLPETPPSMHARFRIRLGDEKPLVLTLDAPVIHKYVDRAIGELYRPFTILPVMTTNIGEKIYLFADDQPQKVKLLVKAHKANLNGKLNIQVPEGWKVSPEELALSFKDKGEEQQLEVTVYPSSQQGEGNLTVTFKDGTNKSSFSLQTIEYDHIPTQLIFGQAQTRLVRVGLKKAGEKIAYIMGSGDEIPMALRQIGYQVDLLANGEITKENLRQYDAVIAGIRVYNTNTRMPYLQNEIFEYVAEGGTYIVQYNTSRGISTNQPGPYPIRLSRDRVAVEEAPIKILNKRHPIFNFPNKITQADFEGWVQERGLYFPNEWDKQYEALIECNDPGETPKQGALLVAKHGEGYFIYTGLSFFRELPAGVSGAYRLFTNMISIGKSPNR